MDHQQLAEVGLRYEVEGAVGTIVLDRPEVHNAQTPAMWRTMRDLGSRILADESVRVVVVRGAGRSFSAGLDRTMLDPTHTGQESVAGLLALDDDQVLETIGIFQEGMTFLADPRIVSIAQVHGHAIGAGFQLALNCDLVIAAEDAGFAMKEVALGLVPDLAGTKPLVQRVGYGRALEICATARTLGAEEARALGLVLDVVPLEELSERTAALVAALTAPVPGAVRAVKEVLLGAERRSLDEQRLVERTAQVGRFRELAALIGQG